MGCTVDTVTLSYEQKMMTEQRASERGLSDRVRVHLCDYRDLPPSFEHAFDALVSCEMVEVGPVPVHFSIRASISLSLCAQAVGPNYLKQFVRVIDWALKEDRATMVITATSQPEFRYTDYQ